MNLTRSILAVLIMTLSLYPEGSYASSGEEMFLIEEAYEKAAKQQANVEPQAIKEEEQKQVKLEDLPVSTRAFYNYICVDKHSTTRKYNWFMSLDKTQATTFLFLCKQLVQRGIEYPAHADAFYACLDGVIQKEKTHGRAFSKDFLELLGHMPAPEACQFVEQMWTIIPTDSYKWFCVVQNFLCQLPVDEHNLTALNSIMDLHNVRAHQNAYRTTETDLDTKVKLRKMRAALYTAKGEPINVEALKTIYAAPLTNTDIVKVKTERFLNASSVALKDAGEVAFGVIVGPPFLLYLLLSGQGICH